MEEARLSNHSLVAMTSMPRKLLMAANSCLLASAGEPAMIFCMPAIAHQQCPSAVPIHTTA